MLVNKGLYIVAYLLKARIVESEETAVARKLHGKHISSVTNTHATIEELLEAVFSLRSVPRLYKESAWWPMRRVSTNSWRGPDADLLN
jgi:hypothetical protein